MNLSIIIVNYNVKHFLEQCLFSVRRSVKDLKVEIFVVDNNSFDGSCAMIKEKFPEVILIKNSENLGFSKANNQAIKQAKGQYVLLLNPDTVLEESSLTRCFEFMNSKPECGALGVKMIDGTGNFLPESKRSLPTPMVSFYKIFGLSYLFPKSKRFGRYHLGFLDKDKTHEIEILPGAFMFIRKEALDKTGLLDETFFMYGEDIDLSYRIAKAGYKIFYFPETTIIHYKGESTKKGSVNYVIVFYQAMGIFAKKHFSQRHAFIFNILIHIAIYIRAAISMTRRLITNFLLPFIDALLIYTGFLIIIPLWENFTKNSFNGYDLLFISFLIPVYIFIWLNSMYFSSAYEKPISIINILKGVFSGTLFILVFYALLPETMRFSRALILIGTLWTLISSISLRLILSRIYPKHFIFKETSKRILIIGNSDIEKVEELLKESRINHEIVGIVSTDESVNGKNIGTLSDISEIIRINNVTEVIFCVKDMPSKKIIQSMLLLSKSAVEFKIFNPDALTIIGSNSIHTNGEIYMIRFDSIAKDVNRTKKRIFDIVISFSLLLVFLPLCLLYKNKIKFFRNIMNVFTGKFSWVGYFENSETDNSQLPTIRKGILNPSLLYDNESNNIVEQINIIYARDYSVFTDFHIMLKGIGRIDV